MKKYLILFLAICIVQLMALNVSGSNTGNSGCTEVHANSTATDGGGNVFVTGSFCGPSITFGTITLTNPIPGYTGSMFIVKYDAAGTALWAVCAGGAYGNGISTDGEGNVYVTGTFNLPSIIFCGTTSVTITLTNPSGDKLDMYIVKYSAVGEVKWAQCPGGYSSGISVSADVSGNIYVTGEMSSPTLTFGTTILINAAPPYDDMYIVKYDTYGTVQWAKSAGGSDSDYGNSIATDGSGNVYVTGRFGSSTITFGSTVLTNAYAGKDDIFIVKYDAGGTVQWAQRAGGSDYDMDGAVAIGVNGDVYVTGSFSSPSIAFGNNITLTNADNSGYINKVDMFIVKYGTDGNAVWAKNAGGRSNGWGIAAHSSENGENVFVTGGFNSPSITFGNIILTTNKKNGEDIFTVNYDAAGNVLWAKSAGGTGSDAATSIAADGSGNAYVVGDFTSPVITFGKITLTNSNKWRAMFIAKYDATGNVPWAKCVISGSTNVHGNPNLKNEGINNELTDELTVYPNPTSGKVILSTANSQSLITSVSVFNMIGKEVLSRQSAVGSRQIDVDLSYQPKGLYIILIKAGENFYQKKIIIE